MSGPQVSVGPSRSTSQRPQRGQVLVYRSAPGSFYDSITVGGKVPTITAGSFFVRQLMSRVPLLDGAVAFPITPPDNDGNNIRYDWQSSDITLLGEGDLMAWWRFVSDGVTRETPEFPIVITDHGPGHGAQTGVVVDGVAAFMPISLSALRKDERFGDLWLQQQADVIKYRVMGTAVPADTEESYHPVLQDFLSKRLALALTKPAIEYWSRQQRTRTSTQSSEVSSYPDMVASLKELTSRLVIELAAEWRDLLFIVPGLPQRRVLALPATTYSDQTNPKNLRVTADPQATQDLMTGGFGFGLLFGNWPFPIILLVCVLAAIGCSSVQGMMA